MGYYRAKQYKEHIGVNVIGFTALRSFGFFFSKLFLMAAPTTTLTFRIDKNIWSLPETLTDTVLTSISNYQGTIKTYPTLNKTNTLYNATNTAYVSLCNVSYDDNNTILTACDITMLEDDDERFTVSYYQGTTLFVIVADIAKKSAVVVGLAESADSKIPIPIKLQTITDHIDYMTLSSEYIFTVQPLTQTIAFTAQEQLPMASIMVLSASNNHFVYIWNIYQTSLTRLSPMGINLLTTSTPFTISNPKDEDPTVFNNDLLFANIQLIIENHNSVSVPKPNENTIMLTGQQPNGKIIVYDYSADSSFTKAISLSENCEVFIPAAKKDLCMLGSQVAIQHNLQTIYDAINGYLLQDQNGLIGVNVNRLSTDIIQQIASTINSSSSSSDDTNNNSLTTLPTKPLQRIYDYTLQAPEHEDEDKLIGPLTISFKLPRLYETTTQTEISAYVIFNQLAPSEKMFYMYYGNKPGQEADTNKYIIFSPTKTLTEVASKSDNIYIKSGAVDANSDESEKLLSINLISYTSDENTTIKILYNDSILPIETNMTQEDYNNKVNNQMINIDSKLYNMFNFGYQVESFIAVETTEMVSTASLTPAINQFGVSE